MTPALQEWKLALSPPGAKVVSSMKLQDASLNSRHAVCSDASDSATAPSVCSMIAVHFASSAAWSRASHASPQAPMSALAAAVHWS